MTYTFNTGIVTQSETLTIVDSTSSLKHNIDFVRVGADDARQVIAAHCRQNFIYVFKTKVAQSYKSLLGDTISIKFTSGVALPNFNVINTGTVGRLRKI